MFSGAPNKYTSFSDSELMDQYRQSLNLEIISALFQRYMVLVYGICMKYLKNRDDSKDAVMQIFEVIAKDVPRFEIRNFKSWLYGVSRNYCLMQLRKDYTEKLRHEKFLTEFLMETSLDPHPIETEDEYLKEQLKECMEKLKEEQRKCLELFYYESHCYKEISEFTTWEENKVKSFIQNGKRNLKICIESKAIEKNVAD